jgi:hypothetical protein
MPIEFRCSQCGKLLRTGDETAGRQAQCPECGALSKVPDLAGAAAAPDSPSPPPGGDSPFGHGGSPFASGIEGAEAKDSGNPYQSPQSPSAAAFQVGQADPYAAQRVSAPATALIVVAWLDIILHGFIFLVGLFILIVASAGAGIQGEERASAMAGSLFYVFAGVFGAAIGILVLIGARKMKKLESYGFAMTAAILSVIPCFSPCGLIGLAFGIWALVVLSDSSVKMAFRN